MDALADRNLLFGLLALQNGMIDQSALILAFTAWTRDKARSLAEILLDQRAIDDDDRAALSAMAARHLKRHGNDSGKSLAAVPAARSLHQSLAALADPDVDATLGHISASSPTATEAGAEATGTYGAPAGDGRRFRILRPHAKGGLGEVFVALDDELHREVALKQILDHHADDSISRTRFLLEAEITGGLEHPGIVPVYGLGSHGNGRPYYAMRFIRGDSLKEAIAAFHADESLEKDHGKRSLALRKLLRRFVDVCNAIDYAHGRGVLHRDLKPANVIVGKYGETLVVDWGLAKPIGKSEAGAPTEERTLMPSLRQRFGRDAARLGVGHSGLHEPRAVARRPRASWPRSDVYSLGATLYCLLTGKAPFEGDDLGAILRAVQKGEFPRPRQVDPTIDRALEAVCLKAMATGPEDRYASARALADDLERWSADEPVSAYRDPFLVRLARWTRRHRTGVALGAGVLQTAVVVLAVSTILLGQSRARVERERSRSQAVNDFLIKDLLSQADPEQNPVGDRVTVRDLLDKAAASVELEPVVEGPGGRRGGDPLDDRQARIYSLGLYQPAEKQLARAVECQEKATAFVPPAERISTRNMYLWTLYKEHKYDGLGERFQEAAAEAARVLGPESQEAIFATDSQAALMINQGSKSNALKIYRKILEIQTRLHGPEGKLTLRAAGNLVSGLMNSYGTSRQADERVYLTEAESLAHATRLAAIHAFGPESVEALRNAAYEGRAQVILKKYAEAAALLGPLMAQFARVFGPDSLTMAEASLHLGRAEMNLGHLQAAEPLLRKAYEGRRAGIGPNIFMTHEVLRDLARVEFGLGKLDEVVTLGRDCFAHPTQGPAREFPSVEELRAALAGEGDVNFLKRAIGSLQGVRGSSRVEDDWIAAYYWCLLLESMYREGHPLINPSGATEDNLKLAKDNLRLLEGNPNTPKRVLTQTREFVAKLVPAKSPEKTGAAAGGRP